MMLVYATRNARRDTMELALSVGDPVLTFVEKDMMTGACFVINGGGDPAKRGGMVEVLVASLTKCGRRELVAMDSVWIIEENVPQLMSHQGCLVLFAANNNNNP